MALHLYLHPWCELCARSRGGTVTLMGACERGEPEVVKMLLDGGVSMKQEYTATEDEEE